MASPSVWFSYWTILRHRDVYSDWLVGQNLLWHVDCSHFTPPHKGHCSPSRPPSDWKTHWGIGRVRSLYHMSWKRTIYSWNSNKPQMLVCFYQLTVLQFPSMHLSCPVWEHNHERPPSGRLNVQSGFLICGEWMIFFFKLPVERKNKRLPRICVCPPDVFTHVRIRVCRELRVGGCD